MRKKNCVTIKKRFVAMFMTGIMGISMLAGFSPIALTAKAEETNHGLSNPRLDKENHAVTYDCVYFGNYWQEDTNGDGEANKQDDKSPIKWRVLSVDGDDAFLIADQNLDMQTYNDTDVDVTWEICTMRSWLNGYGAASNVCDKDYTGAGNNFMSNAFNESEQNAIASTVLANNDNPNYGTEGGNDTTDKLFLLSLEDIANEAYGFTNYRNKEIEDDAEYGNGKPIGKEYYGEGKNDFCSIRDYAKLRTNTAFAKWGDNTASGYSNTMYIGTGWWWLRSPGQSSSDASIVDYVGYVSDDGGKIIVGASAVCPALHLNLSSSDLWSKAESVTVKSGTFSGDSHTHTWNDGTITTPATCGKEGIKTYTCTIEGCGKTKTETVPATGSHSWNNGTVTTNPTETAEGVRTYKCTVCGTVKTETVAKLSPTQSPTGSETETSNASSTAKLPVTGAVITNPKDKASYVVTASGTVTDGKVIGAEVAFKAADKNAKNVTVPKSVTIDGVTYNVTSIKDNAFKNNKNIIKVTVGENVTIIGKNAFFGCKKLKTITIKSKKLKSVGKNTFKGIDSKAVIKVPKKQKKAYYKKLFTKKTGFKKTMKIK